MIPPKTYNAYGIENPATVAPYACARLTNTKRNQFYYFSRGKKGKKTVRRERSEVLYKRVLYGQIFTRKSVYRTSKDEYFRTHVEIFHTNSVVVSRMYFFCALRFGKLFRSFPMPLKHDMRKQIANITFYFERGDERIGFTKFPFRFFLCNKQFFVCTKSFAQ
jgi:hypothetical protein